MFVLVTILLFNSCCRDEVCHKPPQPQPPVQSNIDVILVNKTLYDNLRVYYIKDNEDCSSYIFLDVLKRDQNLPIHVPPGQIIYIRYCALPDANICIDCRLKKLIGNVTQQKIVELDEYGK